METIITNIIIGVVIAAIIGLAVLYVVKAKKSGRKCIGCPDSKICSSAKNTGKEASSCGGCCSCCSGCTPKETDE